MIDVLLIQTRNIDKWIYMEVWTLVHWLQRRWAFEHLYNARGIINDLVITSVKVWVWFCSSVSADDGSCPPVALGAKRSAPVATTDRQMCILCQEEQDILHNDRAMVLSAFVQK